MSEREPILARIREALKSPAPQPGMHDHHDPIKAGARDYSKWLPPAGGSFEEQVELFRTNSADLRTNFRLLDSLDHASQELAAMSAADGWKKISTHAGSLTKACCTGLGLPIISTNGGYDVNEMESCDAGITECDALVAQTGTIVLTSRSAGGRAVSVLPPHHVVLARREQFLPDLPSAFAMLKQKYSGSYPSMIALVTGPSRTGDIERILVLGAHGPKRLTVLCF